MHAYLDLLAKVGRYALPVVIPLFVADFAGMCVYTIRHGSSDEDRVPSPSGALPNTRRFLAAHYHARATLLADKEERITDHSLVDGTATHAQRMIVRGIKLAFLLFWLIFVCVGLIMARTDYTGLLFFIIPSIWFFGAMRLWRKGAKEARARVARRAARPENFNQHA